MRPHLMRPKTSRTSRLFGATALLAGSAAAGLAGLAAVSGDAGATPLLKRFYEARQPGIRHAKFNPLRVGIYAAGGNKVEVVLTNASRKTLRIPRWQLPDAAAGSNVFEVSRDGQRMRFEGAMVKRGVPTAEEFAIVRPGHSYRAVVDLSGLYGMTAGGTYTVAYNAPLQYASLSGPERLKEPTGMPMTAKSVPIRVNAVAAASSAKIKPPQYRVVRGNSNTAFGLNIAYSGCSVDRQDLIGNAVVAARQYSENSRGYLNSAATGPRYTSWFGAYNASRYATVQQNFVKIDNALDQNDGSLRFNCVCDPQYINAFAYVFSSLQYEIYLCNAFWSASLLGTDSKAGTLIHEMSHFNIVAGTEDYQYGQTNARNLAINNPTQAIDNADNHEYFAENTPAQN
jgi:peptidyl-Lys metalloendopeptidase